MLGKKAPSQVMIQKAPKMLHLCTEKTMCHLLHCGIKYIMLFSMFHRAFLNSIIDKTPTHALSIQHYISLAC